MLIVTDAAETLPVTRAQALAQLRILDESSLDTGQLALIDDLVEEAVEKVEIETGLTLSPKGMQQSFSGWPCGRTLELSASPVRQVTEIAYLDDAGAEQTLDASDWTWEPTGDGAVIALASGWSRPSLSSNNPFPVRVRFWAGCNDPAGTPGDPRLDLPRPARTAIRLLIEAWFRNPASQGVMVEAAEDLCTSVKVYR